MQHKIITKVVKEIKVYGPTDTEEVEKVLDQVDGLTVYRSDYLDKLGTAIEQTDAKYVKSLHGVNNDAEARGFDGDHPYITREKGVSRAWRYIATVISG